MHTFDGASCQKYEKLKKMRPLSGKRVGSMQCKVIGIRLRKFSTKIYLRSLQASHRRLLSLQLPHFLDLPDKHKRKRYSEGLSTTLHPLAFVHQLSSFAQRVKLAGFADSAHSVDKAQSQTRRTRNAMAQA